MYPQQKYEFTISAEFERPMNALFYVKMLDDNDKQVMSDFVNFDPADEIATVKFTLNEYNSVLESGSVRFNLTCAGSEPQ